MVKQQIDELHELTERASDWPQEAQHELVQSLLDIEARYQGVYVTTKDDRDALKRSEEDFRAGNFASNEEVRKVFHQFHRA
jgi:hypothetical protein